MKKPDHALTIMSHAVTLGRSLGIKDSDLAKATLTAFVELCHESGEGDALLQGLVAAAFNKDMTK